MIDEVGYNMFWHWFSTVAATLHKNLADSSILQVLDSKVRDLGSFDWEVGPFNEFISYLAISPNLDQELLPVTKKIIDNAPKTEGWIFLGAKPPKEYSPNLNLLNEYGDRISVDTSSWHYKLYYFQQGNFDIDVKIGPVKGNQNTQRLAIDIVLTNILGEEKYMNLIKGVHIVDDVAIDSRLMSPIRYLNDHIKDFLNDET